MVHAVQKLRGLGESMLCISSAQLLFELEGAPEQIGTALGIRTLKFLARVDGANDHRRDGSIVEWI